MLKITEIKVELVELTISTQAADVQKVAIVHAKPATTVNHGAKDSICGMEVVYEF